jgi:hypothetical protein
VQGEAPCWEATAEFLADRGFRIALPDLHATPQTTPAALGAADAVKLVAESADALQVICCFYVTIDALMSCLPTTLQKLSQVHAVLQSMSHAAICVKVEK